MGWQSLGRVVVTSAGTIQQATKNLTAGGITAFNSAGKSVQGYAPCEQLIIQAANSNAGQIYIGLSGFSASGSAAGGKLYTLPAPSAGVIPWIAIGPLVSTAINAADIYIDAASSADGADISIVVP